MGCPSACTRFRGNGRFLPQMATWFWQSIIAAATGGAPNSLEAFSATGETGKSRILKRVLTGQSPKELRTMYGSDQYVMQYDNELGPPWRSQDTWIKVSYPFFHADRIRTPTLFMGGQRDFNVPIVGSEQ